jgi:hypothetical protein
MFIVTAKTIFWCSPMQSPELTALNGRRFTDISNRTCQCPLTSYCQCGPHAIDCDCQCPTHPDPDIKLNMSEIKQMIGNDKIIVRSLNVYGEGIQLPTMGPKEVKLRQVMGRGKRVCSHSTSNCIRK